GVGVGHVVLDAGGPRVGLACDEIAGGGAVGTRGGELSRGHGHHHVGILVAVIPGAGAGGEAPFGNPDGSIVELHCGHGAGSGHGHLTMMSSDHSGRLVLTVALARERPVPNPPLGPPPPPDIPPPIPPP